MKKHAAPIMATILLLLPMLYVGSYLALVVPGGYHYKGAPFVINRQRYSIESWETYRIKGQWVERIFWPLFQIDRRVRPGAWDSKFPRRKSRLFPRSSLFPRRTASIQLTMRGDGF